ncbi:MAG: LPS export ABC transporter periplasmic protein LptC [Endomicrobium sp.]|jgi:LPS export ABC transporter protein LptC|nr:LPS export ABC transporter periplasmic protein LptC [Endomicrobium sp.]MDR2398991.1 LPS export ABC transporter periplasmic protein LptC [Endomicrobium sp.]
MYFCKKNLGFIISFFSIFLFFACKSEKVVIEEMPPMSEQTIEKFTITQTENGKLKMMLEAESAIIDENTNIAHLNLPIVKFYDNGNYASTLIAQKADVNLDTNDVKGIGKCIVDTANKEHIQTTDLMYNAKKNLLYSDNDVKIKKPGHTIFGTRFDADIKLEKVTIRNQRTVFD